MNKINKILLSLGTVGTAVAPVAAVVSCGGKESTREFNILPTYTGQADQLIALGVKVDYYPRQLNTDHVFSYITDPQKFMVKQTKEFQNKFATAVNKNTPSTQGPSWWNQDAIHSDEDGIDNSYWQKQHGNIMLYEHYLLDDGQKIIEKSWAPKHEEETAIQTNFRASRDPYTRIPKAVFFGWDISKATIDKMAVGTQISSSDLTEISKDGLTDPVTPKILEGAILDGQTIKVTTNGEQVVVDKATAEIIQALRNKRSEFLGRTGENKGKSDWFYNDWFFVDFFHRNYLDNIQFNQSHFKDWIIDSTKHNPFDANRTTAGNIKALFDASTYRQVEVKKGLPHSSTAYHHPIYEQQGGEIGAAPMFEGAMRDNQLYLYNVASQIDNLATYGTVYGKQYYDLMSPEKQKEADQVKEWVAKNVSSEQLTEMKSAFDNANEITGELKDRMAKIKAYFNDLGVAGKTFGIFTIAPGHGVSTVQSMSKFSFIYNELGLEQPIPKNLADIGTGAKAFSNGWLPDGSNSNLVGEVIKDGATSQIKDAVGENALFNMDDNGWFWNVSSEEQDSGRPTFIDTTKLEKFAGTFDMGIITATDGDYDAEIGKNSGLGLYIAKLFDENVSAGKAATDILSKARHNADYNLWNEGLKTPFVMHMLLDQIVKKAEEYAEAHSSDSGIHADKIGGKTSASTNYDDAISWGQYFSNKYIK